MKVNITKPHSTYPLGEIEVTEERGQYLVKMKVAEEVKGVEQIVKEAVEVIEDAAEKIMDGAENVIETVKEVVKKGRKKHDI